jgi:hypothetical protein
MAFHRIAFVSYEPWETRLAHRVLEKIAVSNPESECALIVADPFHPVSNNSWAALQDMASTASHKTEVVFRDLLAWQEQIAGARTADMAQRLDSIVEAERIENVQAILSSDVHLAPRERAPFYWPVNEGERLAAGVLVLERTKEIIDDFQPDVIVMMKDQYFVKNAVAAIARGRGIDMRVFRRARYRNYLKLDYFFLPLEPEAARSLEAPEKKQGIREDIALFNNSLYPTNLAVQEESFIQLCRRDPMAAAKKTLRAGWRLQTRFHRRQKKKLRNPESEKARYWVSRPRRVRVWLALRTLRTLRFIFDQRTLARASSIPDRYVLVPLHNRPEATILSRGYGVDDEDVVAAVAKALGKVDPGLACVVLEHPSMVAHRRYRFYRQLKRQGNVTIADPAIPTQELIGKAQGLVTVSGTAGLEASIAGIPVHVAGYPEYLPVIQSHGFERIEDFVRECALGTAPVSRENVISYLESHCYDGWEGELAWGVTRTEETLDSTAETLVEMFDASSGGSSQQ